jgi:hypothetical protein
LHFVFAHIICEVLIVIVTIHVKGFEKSITPKLVPLVIPKIWVGVKVTLVDTMTHAYKVFKTLDIVLKSTHVVKRPRLELDPLAKLVDTIGEQFVDDLATRVK